MIKEDIDRIMFLQMNTVVILTQNVLKQMLVRYRGTIINISSDGAFAVMPRNILYSSTKLFILNFTEGLYMELIDSDFHESAGMNVVKKKTGFMKFMDPDKIVHLAMRDLKIGRVVSLPGLDVKIIQIMKKLLPRKTFYKIIIGFTRKMK